MIDGKARGNELILQGKSIFEIGSGSATSLVLEDSEVASVHLKVYVAGNDVSIFDVSGQGFLHNGKRTLKAAFGEGDRVKVGSHELAFSKGDAPAPALAPPPAAVPAAKGSSSRCELQAVKGNDAGRTYDLRSKEMFIIGRGVATDITVWDIRASRVHCRIDRDGTGYVVTDLNAANGTFVNGQKIETHRLKPGDEIKVGSTVLQYVQQ